VHFRIYAFILPFLSRVFFVIYPIISIQIVDRNIATEEQPFYIMQTYYAIFTFTCCLNINVCQQCVYKITL